MTHASLSACLSATAMVLFAEPAATQRASQWTDVATIFKSHCTICHTGADAPKGLRLDSYAGTLAGSSNGPVLKSGDPEGSELVRRIRGLSEPRMPMTGPPFLSESEMNRIEDWVRAGMPGGADSASEEPSAASTPAAGEKVTYRHVAPILLKRCAVCHKANGKMGAPPEGLSLDSYDAIVAGSERLVVIPGNPQMSEIVRRIEGRASPRMPYDGPPWLEDGDIELIRRWIADGARNADGLEAPNPKGRYVRLRGKLTGSNEIDGAPFAMDQETRIDKQPRVGDFVELRGFVDSAGSIVASRLRRR